MTNDFLTTQFVGKHIADLMEFLDSLDKDYNWEGGVITSGLPIEYSREIYEYVIIIEKTLFTTLLVKCAKKYKVNTSFSLNLDDDFLNYDLIVDKVGTLNYSEANGDLYELAKELNSNASRTIY